jgi:hypothetical protein
VTHAADGRVALSARDPDLLTEFRRRSAEGESASCSMTIPDPASPPTGGSRKSSPKIPLAERLLAGHARAPDDDHARRPPRADHIGSPFARLAPPPSATQCGEAQGSRSFELLTGDPRYRWLQGGWPRGRQRRRVPAAPTGAGSQLTSGLGGQRRRIQNSTTIRDTRSTHRAARNRQGASRPPIAVDEVTFSVPGLAQA